MNFIRNYKAELILFAMMLCELCVFFFESLIPNGIEELILLTFFIAYILCKLNNIDQSLKHRNI